MRTLRQSLGRVGILIVFAVPLCASALFVSEPVPAAFLFFLGLVMAFCAGVLFWTRSRAAFGKDTALNVLSDAQRHDPYMSLITDRAGNVLDANPYAQRIFGDFVGVHIEALLGQHFAAPATSLQRIRSDAARNGHVSDLIGVDDAASRLTVVSASGGLLLWRMVPEAFANRSENWRDMVPLPLVSVEDDGAVTYCNRAARQFFGARRTRLEDIFPTGFTGDGLYGVETLNGPRQVLAQVTSTSGSARGITLVALPDLPDAKSDFSNSDLDSIPIALARLTSTGRILEANAQALELLGAAAAPGAQLARLVEGLGRPVRDWLEDVASGRMPPKSEMVQVRDYEERFIRVSLNPVRGADETALVAVLTDATELKNLEAQFVQSQKMQAIGQLAGGVAHDFNNLLTAISGHCDLLLLRHDSSDPDYGDLMQINQNANRAASLVGQLLAFSRKQNLQLETIDLRNTMGELIHLLNRLVGEKIVLELAHEAGMPPVRADKRQLEQVLMNLVVNARDAMPDGGTIRIDTRISEFSAPFTRDRVVVPQGSYVSIAVTDTGTGIAPDKLTKIFEPFYTTKRVGEGTGLGLSTAYGIVKQTGGYIFVDSTEGQGSTFSLLFPADSPEEDRAEQSSPVQPEKKETKEQSDGVVLLVEDEAPVRAFASRALRMRGYTVLEAENAEEALKTLEDPDLHIDVFVTDVVMPGLDGPTWVRKARKRRPDVHVVFVSGYAEDSFPDKRDEIPNSVFLPKPFSLSELTELVQEQIH